MARHVGDRASVRQLDETFAAARHDEDPGIGSRSLMRSGSCPIPLDAARLAQAHTLTRDFDRWLDALVGGLVFRYRVPPAPPTLPGVYLFAEGSRVLHVGRTKNLQARRQDQTSPSGDRYAATSAFLMARHRAAEVHDDLPTVHSQLAADDRFARFFDEAKVQVQAMDFRCVVIEHDAQQAIFEVFASIALGAPYNFWATH